MTINYECKLVFKIMHINKSILVVISLQLIDMILCNFIIIFELIFDQSFISNSPFRFK